MGDYTRELKAFSVQSKDIVEYTRDYILSMPVGKELDSLVDKYIMNPEASKLMDEMTWFTPKGETEREYPSYSSDISAAWEVVEKMEEQNWWIVLSNDGRGWDATFYWDPNRSGVDVMCDTAPEATCKAALLAVMGL